MNEETEWNKLAKKIRQGLAVSSDFEDYIAKCGMNMSVIALICEYYEQELDSEEKREARKIVSAFDNEMQKLKDLLKEVKERLEVTGYSYLENGNPILRLKSCNFSNDTLTVIISSATNYDYRIKDWHYKQDSLTIVLENEV